MIFDTWTYNQFYMERTSWSAEQKAPIHFTVEEIQWAIEQTEYKYFGSYEFSDQQQMAVEILVWVAKNSIEEYVARCECGTTYSCAKCPECDPEEDYDKLLAKFEAVKEHVQNICKAAGDQPFIATGYMRDVLDKFNGDL